MTRATLAALAALASLALAAAPARAQHGNQSDNGGHYSNGTWGMRSVNEMFSRTGNDVVFRSARVGCEVRAADRAYRDSLGALPQTPAERRVLELLAIDTGTPPVDAVAAALAHGADAGSPLGRAARRLADALSGLMRDRPGCPRERDEYEESEQWKEALNAFQDYVQGAPDSAFSPPAPELVAIHAALQSVITHVLKPAHSRW
jgi:hypothetical protein